MLQVKARYILVPVKSGLMIIDQKRAHERILYEEFLARKESSGTGSQKNLFPETLELQHADAMILSDILSDLNQIGFDINDLGKGHFVINGVPSGMKLDHTGAMIDRILEDYKISESDPGISHREKVAASMARAMAIPYGRALGPEEMHDMIDRLFGTKHPNYTPSGKKILTIMPVDEFEKKLGL